MRKKKNLRHIPLDICERILLRLDAKNILRFKCVCRSWCDLISNPSFAFPQLELSKADPEKSHLRILRTNPLATIDYKAFCDYNSFWGEKECRWNRITTTQVPGDPQEYPRIVGSCDGLVCLLRYDYKVLKSDGGLYNERWGTFSVHGWMVLEASGTFLNRIVHWPAYEKPRHVVAWYDLSAAEVGKIEFPVEIPDYRQRSFTLGVFDGCLGAICKPDKNIEIWLMKEYGVKESWTRLTQIEGFSNYEYKFWRPLGLLKTGELIMDCGARIFLAYDFDGRIRTANVIRDDKGYYIMSDAITYVES